MTLTRTIDEARRHRATRENREAQHRAELRLTEIVKTAGIADDYMTIDRRGDLEMETHFARMFHASPNEEMRVLVTRAFAAWQKDERAEEEAVYRSTGSVVQLLKDNNDVWLNGSAVPVGSDGVA